MANISRTAVEVGVGPVVDKRFANAVAVLLCLALIAGIAIPASLAFFSGTKYVTSGMNLSAAKQAVSSVLAGNPDPGRAASTITGSNNKFKWIVVDWGSSLEPINRLDEGQKNGMYLAVDRNSGDTCLFAITADGKITYALNSRGVWYEQNTVPYSEGIPGVVHINSK